METCNIFQNTALRSQGLTARVDSSYHVVHVLVRRVRRVRTYVPLSEASRRRGLGERLRMRDGLMLRSGLTLRVRDERVVVVGVRVRSGLLARTGLRLRRKLYKHAHKQAGVSQRAARRLIDQ